LAGDLVVGGEALIEAQGRLADADSALDAHDLAVDPVCHGIGDSVRAIVDPGENGFAAPAVVRLERTARRQFDPKQFQLRHFCVCRSWRDADRKEPSASVAEIQLRHSGGGVGPEPSLKLDAP
jgi:hypothetical protein